MLEKVTTHLKENKGYYIAGGTCLVIGVLGGIIWSQNGVEIVDAFKLINWKSSHVSQTVLIRQGHPGNIVRCKETGELFASQNRAAKLLGIDAGKLSEHLRGLRSDVKGLTFETIGEAQAS